MKNEREDVMKKMIRNVGFVVAGCLVTYFCYLFGLSYLTKVVGMQIATFVFSSTLGASSAAMLIALYLERRYGGRREVEKLLPPDWIDRSGDSTAHIVGISGGTYVLPFMAVAVGAAVQKVLALLTAPAAEEALERDQECKRDPVQRRTDFVALTLGVIALALIAIGQFKKRGASVPWWALAIVIVAIVVTMIVYCRAYFQRQYVMGALRARVSKRIRQIEDEEEQRELALKLFLCFFSAEQKRCFRRLFPLLVVIGLVFGLILHWISFSLAAFAVGIFFGVMSLFAVLIMIMDYGKKDKSSHAFSMVFRFVVHKIPSMVAGLMATVGIYIGWHETVPTLGMPSQLEWAGVVVAFVAVLAPLYLRKRLQANAGSKQAPKDGDTRASSAVSAALVR